MVLTHSWVANERLSNTFTVSHMPHVFAFAQFGARSACRRQSVHGVSHLCGM